MMAEISAFYFVAICLLSVTCAEKRSAAILSAIFSACSCASAMFQVLSFSYMSPFASDDPMTGLRTGYREAHKIPLFNS